VDDGVALAIDFGGTKVEAALVDRAGTLLPGSRHRAATGASSTSAQVEEAVATAVRGALSAGGERRILGAGIGAAGPLSPTPGAVSPLNLPAWRDYPLRELVAGLLPAAGDVPVVLRMDGEAIALAEHWIGAGRDAACLLGMVVSTGIGGGLVIGGRTVPGPSGNAGHVGHVAVGDPALAGVRCACGGTGCVEAVASGPRTVAWAREQGWTGATGEELGVGYTAGDPIAVAAVRRSAHAVGGALASATALLDLDVIAIGGGFASVAPDYLELVREAFAGREFPFVRKVRIVRSGLSGEGPLIGAGALIHRAELLG